MSGARRSPGRFWRRYGPDCFLHRVDGGELDDAVACWAVQCVPGAKRPPQSLRLVRQVLVSVPAINYTMNGGDREPVHFCMRPAHVFAPFVHSGSVRSLLWLASLLNAFVREITLWTRWVS
jgi:hypothetical protein